MRAFFWLGIRLSHGLSDALDGVGGTASAVSLALPHDGVLQDIRDTAYAPARITSGLGV
jgi:hypothetical protein